jgi:ppGpp synthetase/RelA/SpoT-type nucleotidyltranferase
MNDFEEDRKRWIADRPAFEEFGREVAGRLSKVLRNHGILSRVESRAKEVDSLVRKLITKQKHTYESLSDKSGVRVILRFKDEINTALSAAAEVLVLGTPEHKIDTMPPDKMGYLSTHVDVALYETDRLAAKFPPNKFRAELQIRTLAQHLWAEISHDSIYKNDETISPVPNALKRRVFNLAGTIELADNEFMRLRDDMPKTPETDLLRILERYYFRYTTRRWDSELSRQNIAFLLPLYGSDIPRIERHLEEFCERHSATLTHVYEEAIANSADQSAFLHQPEAIMIYDLLETDAASTREAWALHYPDKELERLALTFGISFEN